VGLTGELVELFTCQVDGVWMVCWQQFDENGNPGNLGRVTRTAARAQAMTNNDFATILSFLQAARIPVEMVRGTLRVKAGRFEIERVIERKLLPEGEHKIVR
jgi:hypothetical protein